MRRSIVFASLSAFLGLILFLAAPVSRAFGVLKDNFKALFTSPHAQSQTCPAKEPHGMAFAQVKAFARKLLAHRPLITTSWRMCPSA